MKLTIITLVLAMMAGAAHAQLDDPVATARCFAVSQELAARHDQGTEVYNRRNAAYNAHPTPEEAAKLDKFLTALNAMSEASLEILIFYSPVDVPQTIRDEVKSKGVADLLGMSRTCVKAETDRIDSAAN
jgi:hypothetical protein